MLYRKLLTQVYTTTQKTGYRDKKYKHQNTGYRDYKVKIFLAH